MNSKQTLEIAHSLFATAFSPNSKERGDGQPCQDSLFAVKGLLIEKFGEDRGLWINKQALLLEEYSMCNLTSYMLEDM